MIVFSDNENEWKHIKSLLSKAPEYVKLRKISRLIVQCSKSKRKRIVPWSDVGYSLLEKSIKSLKGYSED